MDLPQNDQAPTQLTESLVKPWHEEKQLERSTFLEMFKCVFPHLELKTQNAQVNMQLGTSFW